MKFWRKDNQICFTFWTWVCLTYVRISDPKRVKLTRRVYECVFNEYAI